MEYLIEHVPGAKDAWVLACGGTHVAARQHHREAIAMCTGYGRGTEFTKLESVTQLGVSSFCFKGYLTIRKRSTKFQRILSEQSRIKAICLHATMCYVNYDCGCPVTALVG